MYALVLGISLFASTAPVDPLPPPTIDFFDGQQLGARHWLMTAHASNAAGLKILGEGAAIPYPMYVPDDGWFQFDAYTLSDFGGHLGIWLVDQNGQQVSNEAIFYFP